MNGGMTLNLARFGYNVADAKSGYINSLVDKMVHLQCSVVCALSYFYLNRFLFLKVSFF